MESREILRSMTGSGVGVSSAGKRSCTSSVNNDMMEKREDMGAPLRTSAIYDQTKALFFFQIQGLAGYELSGLHAPGELMEDRPFQISEDLDGAQELVEVVGQAWLAVLIVRVWRQIQVWLLALRLMR
ncbi:hypothetical protein PG990_009452 [Apiospora arundinis]